MIKIFIHEAEGILTLKSLERGGLRMEEVSVFLFLKKEKEFASHLLKKLDFGFFFYQNDEQ